MEHQDLPARKLGWAQRLDQSPVSAYLALAVVIAGLGFSALFVRWAQAPGAVSAFYRVAVGSVLMAGPFWAHVRRIGPLPRRAVEIAVLSGVFFAADLGTWSTGVMMGGATNPTLLANTAPLWVGLGAVLLFREKLPVRFWIGLLLAMAGAALILGLESLRGLQLGLGSFLGLLAGVFYGSYQVLTQRVRQDLDSLTSFWISVVSSTLCLLLVSLGMGLPLTGYPLVTYIWFLVAGLVSQVAAYLAMTYALGKLPASLVSPTLLAQPVVTALLAALLLGEALGEWQIVGGIAVLSGVVLVHQSRRNKG